MMKSYFSEQDILEIKKRKKLDESLASFFEINPKDFERFLKTQDAIEYDLVVDDDLSEKAY